MPLSRWREAGIKRRALDNDSNRVLACQKCNAEKANKLPDEWFALHPEYKARFLREAKYLSETVRRLCEA